MLNKKHKRRLITWIVVSSVVLTALFLSLVIFQSKSQPFVSYYYDKDLGLITFKISKNNIFAFTKQSVYFINQNVPVNTQTSFIDSPSFDTLSYGITKVTVTLKSPSDKIITVSKDVIPMVRYQSIRFEFSFTPNEAGLWTATTFYDTPLQTRYESGSNSLIVVNIHPPPPTCDKRSDPEYVWNFNSNIDGGRINIGIKKIVNGKEITQPIKPVRLQ